jgi:spoIIIJ-associated protein
MGQRFEGRSLEEALQNASQELGAERYQLTYHVVVEKRGFLGGLKRIVIEASVNEGAAAPPPPRPAPAERPSPAARPPREARGRGGARREERRDRGGRRDRPRGDDREPRVRAYERHDAEFTGEVPEQGEQSPAARRVSDWCTEMLSLARLDVAVRTEETDEAISVRLYGRDTGRFTERDGELLDSVQVICNKALTHHIEKAIEFDCGSFKDERADALGRQALQAAERVRAHGREQILPAMSPIERRIVHIALRDADGVTTESRGDGFFKRVAIVPKEEQPAEP